MNKSQLKDPLSNTCQASADGSIKLLTQWSSGATRGNFFATVKSSDANITISDNFLLNTKNSNVFA